MQSAELDPSTVSVHEAVITCAGLTKVFRDFWMRSRVRAVDGIDLDVRRGEVFGLLGPNGSGKSTTIKMLLGLLRPTSGRIAVFGKRPEDVAIKKQIGYLPEESYLYRFLNARETLDYYGRLFHQDRHQRQRRIEMLLKMVGLETAQRRPVGEYSKGMQRRIGLAQALINDPQLLILDEPTTGLDPIGMRQIKDLILTLKSRGKTILLCSHLLADVEDVCDRVAIMFGGKVQRYGTVDDLLTDENATTIRTNQLDAETLGEVRALLERKGKSIESVEQPRQRLEALFLEIVQEAQARGQVTSGAASGGVIADFLSGGEGAVRRPEAEPEKVIEELMSGPAKPQAAEVELEKVSEPVETEKELVSELIAKPQAAPVPHRPATVGEETEHPDQSFIDALLNVAPTPPGDQGDDQARRGGR